MVICQKRGSANTHNKILLLLDDFSIPFIDDETAMEQVKIYSPSHWAELIVDGVAQSEYGCLIQ